MMEINFVSNINLLSYIAESFIRQRCAMICWIALDYFCFPNSMPNSVLDAQCDYFLEYV